MTSLAKIERLYHEPPETADEVEPLGATHDGAHIAPDLIRTDDEAVEAVAWYIREHRDTDAPEVIQAALTLAFGARVIRLTALGDLISEWPASDAFATQAERDDMAESIGRALGDWRGAVAAARPRRIRDGIFSRAV